MGLPGSSLRCLTKPVLAQHCSVPATDAQINCPWPTCPEGGAGAPGFAKYADCPAGWEPSSTKGSGSRSQEAQLCVKRDVTCDTGPRKTGVSPITCIGMQTMPRPLRSDPYYFDIKDDASGATERHFFNLRR
jgi:hypothetical protein